MYTYKAIRINGKKIDEHRFVMESKIGKRLGFNRVVHHKDEDPRNNNIDNLEILSRAAHGRLHGTGRKLSLSAIELVRNANQELRPNARLSVDQVLQIRKLLSNRVVVQRIAERFNIGKRTVYDIKAGKTWYWLTDEYLLTKKR
jgi:HNH endonuclease